MTNIEEKAVEIKTMCEQASLEIPALDTYVAVGQTDEAALVLRAAARIGCPLVRLLAPQYDGSRPYDELFAQARRELARLEPICRDLGVKAAVETHMSNIIPSASAALRLVEAYSPESIAVIYDPGNMVNGGMEHWKMAIQVLGPYLGHVHVKNSGWYYSEELGWKFGWAGLQDGIVHWPEVLRVLAEAGYRGWLSVEDFTDAPVEQKLEEDITLLRRLLTEVQPMS